MINRLTMKDNLRDFTFLIPLRVDSIVRIENLLAVINYILKYFDSNIKILQACSYENGLLPKLLNKRVEYIFVEDKDPIFYKTKYQNQLTELSETSLIGTLDADIIIPPSQIIEAVTKLREGYDIAYPYDGYVYDTNHSIRELFMRRKNSNVLFNNQNKMPLMYGTQIKGGAMFVNKDAYIRGGLENEKFYGWGNEDVERYDRWKILNYKIHCCHGCLFHLSHPRGINSDFHSINQANNATKELFLTKLSSKTEMLNCFYNKDIAID